MRPIFALTSRTTMCTIRRMKQIAMSDVTAEAPTSMEIELLRELTRTSQDRSLVIAVLIASSDARLANGLPLTDSVRRANARCLLELERWRATQVAEIDLPQILDMAASAIRGADYHALKVCNLAISCPPDDATSTSERAWRACLDACLVAWNARAARLASVA